MTKANSGDKQWKKRDAPQNSEVTRILGCVPFFPLSVPGIAFALFLLAIPAASQTPAGEQIGLRMISVRTEVEAANVLSEIQSGQSFEAMAKAHSTDASNKDGGFLGLFEPGDLNADLQGAVSELMPGQISPVTRVGGEFL